MDNIINNYQYIYIDSLYALNFVKQKIDINNVELISFNPSLVLKKNENIQSLESEVTPKDIMNIGSLTYKYSGKIYDKLIELKYDSIFAIWISRYLISMQNGLYRAKRLKEFIGENKTLFIISDSGDKNLNNSLNAGFNNLLKGYKNISFYNLEYIPKDFNRLARDPQTKFWIRFNFESMNSKLFRLVTIVSNPLKKFWPGKIIYYSHENTLLKRVAFKLFLKGYLISKFPQESFQKNKHNDNNETINIYKNISNIIELYQKDILGDNYNSDIAALYKKKLLEHIDEFLIANTKCKKDFLDGKYKKILACLFGFPSSAAELSFASLAKKYGIVTASFQHAISKEISEDILSIDSLYESNIVDYFFVFSKHAAINSRKSRFHQSEDIVMGLPEDLKKGMIINKFKKEVKYPILYASTNLYCGNRGIIGRAGATDIDKANFEIGFINKVLGKLPHKVQYKPYFSKRYSGDTVEIDLAKSYSNIFINLDEIDLRYIVGDSKVVITSRSTSTVGWCIFSSKPIIYIENEDNRLNSEARKVFEKGLFLFDVLDKNWQQELLNFLSQDISVIEQQWIKKQKDTDFLLYKYLGYKRTNNDYIALEKILNNKI